MDPVIGRKVFAGLYFVVLIPTMWVVSGGVVDIAALVSLPIIATAQAIVFTMFYAAAFYSEDPTEHHAPQSLKMSMLDTDPIVRQKKLTHR